MSYILGGVTIPNPKKITKNVIENAVENIVMFNRTTKNVRNRKYQYVLEYQYLTQDQVSSLISLYNLVQVLSFQVTEANLPIGPVNVLMDVSNMDYPPTAQAYRENLVVTLTQVV